MNLYATVTSERASKGQGGNEKISINLNIERITVGRVVMRYEKENNDHYSIYYYPITEVTGKGGRILLHEQKGNKQKDEKGKTTMDFIKEHMDMPE